MRKQKTSQMYIPFIATVSLTLFSMLIPLSSNAGTDILKSTVETKLNTQQTNIKSQQHIDKVVEQTDSLARKYHDTIRETDSLTSYNNQLEKIVKQQQLSLDSIQKQLNNIEETQRNIIPFMLRMIDTLEKFVALDLPFLQAERQQRIEHLKEMMDWPDASLPDQYRRIMEAYLIEMEYGRTIEAYNDTIKLGQTEYTVDILRTGRLLMTFQSLDGKLSGVWDRGKKNWEILPSEYNRSVRLGLQIAKKQAPPELIKLPVDVSGKW